jgi:hypothetical protein
VSVIISRRPAGATGATYEKLLCVRTIGKTITRTSTTTPESPKKEFSNYATNTQKSNKQLSPAATNPMIRGVLLVDEAPLLLKTVNLTIVIILQPPHRSSHEDRRTEEKKKKKKKKLLRVCNVEWFKASLVKGRIRLHTAPLF